MTSDLKKAFDEWSRFCCCKNKPRTTTVPVKLNGKKAKIERIIAHEISCYQEKERRWLKYIGLRDSGQMYITKIHQYS